MASAPVLKRRIADIPIGVKIPDEKTFFSTHMGTLDIPMLPMESRLAHIIPQLDTHSLLSVLKLCDAGYEVDMRMESYEIRYRGVTIIKYSKCKQFGFWMIPLTNVATEEVAVPMIPLSLKPTIPIRDLQVNPLKYFILVQVA